MSRASSPPADPLVLDRTVHGKGSRSHECGPFGSGAARHRARVLGSSRVLALAHGGDRGTNPSDLRRRLSRHAYQEGPGFLFLAIHGGRPRRPRTRDDITALRLRAKAVRVANGTGSPQHSVEPAWAGVVTGTDFPDRGVGRGPDGLGHVRPPWWWRVLGGTDFPDRRLGTSRIVSPVLPVLPGGACGTGEACGAGETGCPVLRFPSTPTPRRGRLAGELVKGAGTTIDDDEAGAEGRLPAGGRTVAGCFQPNHLRPHPQLAHDLDIRDAIEAGVLSLLSLLSGEFAGDGAGRQMA